MSRTFRAYPVYLFMQFAYGLFFATYATMSLVYQASVVGLNPLQLVLVGTVLEASYFLAEIPTGVVADVYSRRLSIVIGFIVMGVGFVVAGAVPLFGTVLLGQVFFGVGATFPSGATEAWITDELDYERNQAKNTGRKLPPVGQVFLRGTQLNRIGALLGIGVSVALASIAIPLPIVVGGVLFIGLGGVLLLVMPEEGFTRAPRAERETWSDMAETLRSGLHLIRLRPVLITILLGSALFGAFSEGFDRLWTPHVLDNFTLPALGSLDVVVWFGIIAAVSNLMSLGVSEVARRRVTTESHRSVVRALLLLNGLLMVAVIAFALATNFALALIAFWLSGAFRIASEPLYMAWLNQYLEPRTRATVISLSGQSNALGQMAFGPAVGAIGTIYSLRAALTTAGLLLVPVSLLYARTLRPASIQATETYGASND
jgi:DHA3 family tetracycline resistance protein-like MFS transporter